MNVIKGNLMGSEEAVEKAFRKWLDKMEEFDALEWDEEGFDDLSDPEPYTEEELEELYRQHKT